jgi:hypothetical protein
LQQLLAAIGCALVFQMIELAGIACLVGGFVTGVKTNPSDGTIELEGALGSITTKPTVQNGGLALQVVNLSGLGFTLPRERSRG